MTECGTLVRPRPDAWEMAQHSSPTAACRGKTWLMQQSQQAQNIDTFMARHGERHGWAQAGWAQRLAWHHLDNRAHWGPAQRPTKREKMADIAG